tara:strand:+ start:275 stop:667 length:393 start_codon:yes stop_codon:yes gene_type:complete
MKRLLLPLLAALALPTAVNAETIYLECKFVEYEPLVELAINPNADKGTIRTISNSTGESSYKANQFIKSDSYSLKAMTSTGTSTYTVSRIDGSATSYYELSEKYKKLFPENVAKFRNGSCKKKEKVETLF